MLHIPVLAQEIKDIALESIKSNNSDIFTFFDCTFGAGGHSRALLNLVTDSSTVNRDLKSNFICIDRDPVAQLFFNQLFSEDRSNIFNKLTTKITSRFFNTKFSELGAIISKDLNANIVLMDLGFSSMQIDSADRGFAIYKDGDLKMTMGCNEIDAAYIVNSFDKNKLEKIFSIYGEERLSEEIASEIIYERKQKRILTTAHLVSVIERAYLKAGKRGYGKIHNATLVFQGLRIFINNEMYEIAAGILSAAARLSINGKLLIITFHGLEDIIVKATFKTLVRNKNIMEMDDELYNAFGDNINLVDLFGSSADKRNSAGILINQFYRSVIGDLSNMRKYKVLNSGNVIRPTIKEIRKNKRARSAKLRIIERVM